MLNSERCCSSNLEYFCHQEQTERKAVTNIFEKPEATLRCSSAPSDEIIQIGHQDADALGISEAVDTVKHKARGLQHTCGEPPNGAVLQYDSADLPSQHTCLKATENQLRGILKPTSSIEAAVSDVIDRLTKLSWPCNARSSIGEEIAPLDDRSFHAGAEHDFSVGQYVKSESQTRSRLLPYDVTAVLQSFRRCGGRSTEQEKERVKAFLASARDHYHGTTGTVRRACWSTLADACETNNKVLWSATADGPVVDDGVSILGQGMLQLRTQIPSRSPQLEKGYNMTRIPSLAPTLSSNYGSSVASATHSVNHYPLPCDSPTLLSTFRSEAPCIKHITGHFVAKSRNYTISLAPISNRNRSSNCEALEKQDDMFPREYNVMNVQSVDRAVPTGQFPMEWPSSPRPLLSVPSGSNTPRSESSQNISALGTGGGYAALRAHQAARSGEAAVKKRGRPVGWRKWMQRAPSASSSGPTANRPHPSQRPHKRIPEARYQVYKCGWELCQAKLHNLDTLRKHIYKKHAIPYSDGHFECHWADCDELDRASPVTNARKRFTSYGMLKDHLESHHILRIAWKYGDGPTAGFSRTGNEDSNATNGEMQVISVIPNVTMPRYSSDLRYYTKNTGLASMDSNPNSRRTIEDEALKEQWEAQERRKQIGAGVDIEDSFEISAERAKGLIDNATESRVIRQPDDA